MDIKWNGPKWKASHPHTRECGALAGDLSDFKLPVLPRFAGFPTVLEVSIIERGSLARLRQELPLMPSLIGMVQEQKHINLASDG